MKTYGFDECVNGEEALDLNGTEKYMNPNHFTSMIYQDGEANEKGSG
jgi:hypothetical protein